MGKQKIQQQAVGFYLPDEQKLLKFKCVFRGMIIMIFKKYQEKK